MWKAPLGRNVQVRTRGDVWTGHAWRDAQREAATAVVDLLAGSYGPHGGAALVGHDGHHTWLESGASVLREVAVGPTLMPYRRLAESVQRHVGDQATGAVLLAARLVEAGLESASRGLRVPACIGGYQAAARQARALLAGAKEPDEAGACLRAVADTSWAAEVVTGALRLAGDLDLERVALEVRDIPAPRWEPWVASPATAPLRHGVVPVLLARRAPEVRPRTEAEYTVAGHALGRLRQEEALRQEAWLEAVAQLGVGVVVCGQSLGALGDALRHRGVLVWEDADREARRRVTATCGAAETLDGTGATGAALGRAELRRDRGRGTWLVGEGPAWTLLLPGTGVRASAAVETGERLLRATGAWLQEPCSVPGGGQWQGLVAEGLRRSADGLPGAMPLAWQAAATAFEGLGRDLRRNAGLAPHGEPLGGVLDPWPCVREAVDAAFACALQVLRTEGMHRKAGSAPAKLRGGMGPAGSPKGMPGDIPPLM